MGIEFTDESGQAVDGARLTAVAITALDHLRISPDAELSILAVDDDRMAELHVEWMDEPGPTDVLSFPMDELRPGADGEPLVDGVLGDIVLAPSFCREQARAAGRDEADELDLLVVHGVLHLLGFDHAEPDEEKVMVGLQDRILAAHRSAGGAA